MRNRLLQFMAGRCGPDGFNQFLSIAALVCLVINLFTGSVTLYVIALALLVYSLYRMFSRNLARRYQENMAYYRLRNRLRRALSPAPDASLLPLPQLPLPRTRAEGSRQNRHHLSQLPQRVHQKSIELTRLAFQRARKKRPNRGLFFTAHLETADENL